MPFNKRFQIFIFYYAIVLILIGLSVFYNVFGAQSQLFENAISNFIQLRSGELVTLPVWGVMVVSFFFALVPSFILLSFKNRTALFLLIISLLLGAGSWWWALQQTHVIYPLVYSLGSFGIGTIMGVFLKMIFSSAEKDFLRQAFSQFVSEDMLKELLRNPDKLRLTGKEHDITVLFLDIRGFTAFSEKKSPAIVVNRLNELLEIVTQVIVNHDGTVDKYIGDAVMAMWGAPAADKKQATKAIKAAIEIRRKIESDTDFKVGVGINYGKAIIGNIGSSKRFDYTAIGDTVNTASRIESLTKSLGQSIVVSESVLKKVHAEKSEFDVKDLGQVMVKGKQQKIHVFGL